MGKIALTLLFLVVHTAMPSARAKADDPRTIKSWYDELHQARPKLTQLRFYFHDTPSGKNPTSVQVAHAPFTNQSATLFGLVNVFDDPLTEGPNPSSKPVGRAQGLYASAGLESLGLLMNMNLVFTDEKYNGSTLSIMGRNAAMEAYREMPVVGGSGVFRLARGTATARTHQFNATTGDAVVEYNIIAMHY
ncbi:dirigent protein 21-like [Rhodamnia argentea]|uniref:Dirigent protein n=1 Tax=Rhodamnia argentea TaxID=178133 RepID=A0A8B8PD45_9MYRT|nr:dirigent protein 21-like [Rhodamnia argentea]